MNRIGHAKRYAYNISTFVSFSVQLLEEKKKSAHRVYRMLCAHIIIFFFFENKSNLWDIVWEELRIKFTSTHISYERHAGMRKMNNDESHVYIIYTDVGRQFLCERVFRTGMLFYENI